MSAIVERLRAAIVAERDDLRGQRGGYSYHAKARSATDAVVDAVAAEIDRLTRERDEAVKALAKMPTLDEVLAVVGDEDGVDDRIWLLYHRKAEQP